MGGNPSENEANAGSQQEGRKSTKAAEQIRRGAATFGDSTEDDHGVGEGEETVTDRAGKRKGPT
jgi:hypothetical protein